MSWLFSFGVPVILVIAKVTRSREQRGWLERSFERDRRKKDEG